MISILGLPAPALVYGFMLTLISCVTMAQEAASTNESVEGEPVVEVKEEKDRNRGRFLALRFLSLSRQSAGGFAAKFGLAIGAGLSGFLLAGVGFVANTEQTETAMLGIRLMYTVYPAVLLVLGTLALFYYRLTDKQVMEIETELAERRHTPETAQSA